MNVADLGVSDVQALQPRKVEERLDLELMLHVADVQGFGCGREDGQICQSRVLQNNFSCFRIAAQLFDICYRHCVWNADDTVRRYLNKRKRLEDGQLDLFIEDQICYRLRVKSQNFS